MSCGGTRPASSQPSGVARLLLWDGARLESGGLTLIKPCTDAGKIPRQQFMDPFDRMVCDACEDLAQIVLRIQHVQFCRLGQREDRCCPFATGIRAGMEPILSSER